MIQEYLFTSDKYKDDIEDLVVPEKVTKEVVAIENSECWTLSISVAGEGKNAAKMLDPLNRQVCDKYYVKSAYY